MLAINMDDVMNVLQSCKSQLTFFGVVLAVAIVIMIAVLKMPKKIKRLIRGEALIAIVLSLLITVNMICTGPMSTMLDLVTGSGSIDAETSAAATELVNEITEEGIVLAKDEGGILPVGEGAKLNVFGWASTSPCYGGTGSGALNTAYPTTSLLQGLNEAGVETNEELTKFYTDYQSVRPTVGMWAQDWTLPEPNVSLYTDELMENAKAYSDTAMIVITRVGGEGADLPSDMMSVVNGTWGKPDGPNASNETYFAGVYDDTMNEGNDWDEGDHFLQLDNREEEMIELVTANFDNIILVYNGANAFELGWVKDYPQIKGVLLVPGTGQSGFAGFGKVVSGAINPSGKTVDTYVSNLKNTPWWNNFGSFVYDNMDEFSVTSESMFTKTTATETPSFVNYVEGIYVGYKFYETAAAEGLIDYDKEVVYPFGYGLSYTNFTQTMSEITNDGTNLNFTVTVTNNGTVAGKDVVEVYVNPPYTNGGIEKASANLIDFAKTQTLEPGASETVTFSIPVENLASFDYLVNGCYVLDAGNYVISINSDSHNVIDSKNVNLTKVVYDAAGKRTSDKVAAVNLFDYAAGDVTYLSRKNKFANYKKATAAPASRTMSDEAKATFFNISNYLTAEATAADEAAHGFTDEPVTTGSTATSLKLVDLRGLDYDDAKWDDLLNQMTLDDYNALISLGGYQTNGVDSIGKVRTNDCDGPASINNNFTGVGSVGFPAATLIAMTWSDELAYKFGDSIGTMADEMDTSGWYGPAMNIHRTAFAGRNFEYYSEDGVLSGHMAANAIKGAQAHGVYAYMKHFALNDQEANRCSMVCTWSNEQAIREIYLKPFEMSVKEGDSLAVMSSFNYIGNRWAGGTYELQTQVLRDEWGFRGFVETDYFGVYNYMSSDQAIRNGTDLMLVNYPTATNNVAFRETNGAQQAMRQSAHRILYVVANSRAYAEENLNPAPAPWHLWLTIANVVVGALLVLWEFALIKKFMKK
ncbi:MAG: glycoside hydrolase family 3 C-terminal domain-containing protein [Oscillospiraceae bacterium]|nr:glycoside hydrolase family 3 C-terminal domain-containing protein [Oscillospiraceae bacterium]